MDLTIFLAHLIGPTMLAVGLGLFVSRNYYSKVYRHLENETLGVLMTGVAALVIGILMVTNHNVWDSFLTGIISLVGWSSLIKGLLLIVVPRTVDKIGDWASERPEVFSFAGVLYLVLGAYVSYMAFLA